MADKTLYAFNGRLKKLYRNYFGNFVTNIFTFIWKNGG